MQPGRARPAGPSPRGRPAAGSGRTWSRARRRRRPPPLRPRRSRRRRAPPADRGAVAPRGRAGAPPARRSRLASRQPRTPRSFADRPTVAGDEERQRHGHVGERRPGEGAGGHVGDQDRLGENEQRREHAEHCVGCEQRRGPARRGSAGAGRAAARASRRRSSARPDRPECRRPPRRAARGRRGTSTRGRARRPGGEPPRRPSSP